MSEELCNFYKYKNILITGGTGFLGLSLIEKILRVFPDVGKIYMIVRCGRRETLAQKKEQYLTNQIFSRLKNEYKVDFSKLIWLEGDIAKPNLGLNAETITDLQQRVNLIIHSAATLNFNESLKDVIHLNIRATNDLLDIASACQNVVCFTYISTAFSKARKSVTYIDENILPHPIDPKDLIHLANTHTREELDAKSEELLLDWPNTYTYSKNAAENLCMEYKNKFSIAIFRPGAVVHSYEEPSPYWIGKNMGFARVMMETHRGLIYNFNPCVNLNSVPVDMTINAILASTFKTAIDKKLMVFNYTTNNNPFECTKIINNYIKAIENYKTVLIPHRKELLMIKKAPIGSKQEKMIQEIYKYHDMQNTIHYFLEKKFTFCNDNIDNLWASMNPDERKLIPFDVRVIDWEEFYRHMYDNAYGTKKIEFEDILM